MTLRLLITGFLCGLILCITGCNGYPKGMKEFRKLTEEEKERLVEIAFDTPEAKQSFEKYSEYSVELFWGYMTWRLKDGEYQAGGSQLVYDEGFDENPFSENERDDGELYYFVLLFFGESPKESITVAINPDNEKIANVQYNVLKPHK
ncbi:hypothetical protein ACFLXY_08815 [Chloroflexota bacterium]